MENFNTIISQDWKVSLSRSRAYKNSVTDQIKEKLGMKVIIAGSRKIEDVHVLSAALQEANFHIGEVVCGCAAGVDRMGAFWAKANNKPVKYFPADWDSIGKGAGFVRNQQMADYADALIAIWDGESKGTAHMIDCAHKKGIKVYVHRTDKREIQD